MAKAGGLVVVRFKSGRPNHIPGVDDVCSGHPLRDRWSGYRNCIAKATAGSWASPGWKWAATTMLVRLFQMIHSTDEPSEPPA
jgi:hypothetical protein